MVSHIDDETPDPVLDERVRAVLDALAAPTEVGPLPGELDAVAAFRAEQRTRRISMSHVTPFRMAVASAVGAGVFLTGGVAAAVTGSLPADAQDTARTVLGVVGVSVPAGDENADDRADDVRGPGEGTADEEVEVDVTPVAAVDDVTPAEQRANETAALIVELAQMPYDHGVDRGRAVSEAASGESRVPDEVPQGSSDNAPAGPETGQSKSEGKSKAPADPSGTADGDDADTEDETSENGAPDGAGPEMGDEASSAGVDNGGRP